MNSIGINTSNRDRGDKYAEKKTLAILAAAKIFSIKGYHGSTTGDIASELGIKQGSLYYYFKSKEQALQDVCEFGLKEYVGQMRDLCDQNSSISEKIRAVFAAHLSNYRNQYSAMKVHNDQRLYLAKERRSLIKKLGTEYRTLLEQLLQRAVEQGQLREEIDAHFIAYSIIGLGNSWGANLMRDETIEIDATVDKLSDMVLHGTLR